MAFKSKAKGKKKEPPSAATEGPVVKKQKTDEKRIDLITKQTSFIQTHDDVNG